MGRTKIEWAQRVWNPVTGCTPISPGCAHCYAKSFATRFAGRNGYPKDDPFAVTVHRNRLEQPLKWTGNWDVFVGSMGDLCHKQVATDFILEVFAVIRRCPQHRFFVLTKRSARMRAIVESFPEEVPGNLWLGVSVEDEEWTNRLWDLIDLGECGAQNLFVSIEPILGPVDLSYWIECLGWVIVGDESGPGRRAGDLDDVCSIRDKCRHYDVPFFFKQWHDEKGKKISMPELDGVVHDARPAR